MKYLTRLIFLISPIIFFACSNQKEENKEASVSEETFVVVEQLPSYEGGMDALYNQLRAEVTYPKEARENNTEGLVEVAFVVERDGVISGVEVVNGIGDGCDEEAKRVVDGIASFVPGRQRGRTVRVRMTMPFIFKLNKTATNPDGSPQGIIVVEEAKINYEKFKVEAKYTDGTCKGKVLSAAGDPLPGANVIITGTNNGTVTGLDGSFSIETSETDKLTISFVGFETYELSMDDC